MLYEASLSDEQKSRLRRLAWTTLSKFVMSISAACGAKLGERAVEWLLGDDEDDDDEPDDEEPKG